MSPKARFRILLATLACTCGVFLWPPSPPVDSQARPSRPRDLFKRVSAYSWSTAPRAKGAATWQPVSQLDSNALQVVEALRRLRPGTNAPQPGAASSPRMLAKPIQEQAIERLRQRYGDRFEVYLRPEKTTPMQIKGFTFPPVQTPPDTPALEARHQTAKAVLNEFRDALLISDPEVELKLNHAETDNLGRSNLRFSQYYQGLEVWPCELSVHFDLRGNADLLDGVFVATPEGIQTQPKLSAADALARGRASVPDGTQGKPTEPVLLIYAPVDGETRLGWKLDLTVGLLHDWQIVIDAENGTALRTANKCMCANVAGSGTDLLGITRPLNVFQQGSTYFMLDTSKPMFNSTTGQGFIHILDANNQAMEQINPDGVFYVVSGTPFYWPNAHAVSAAFNFSATFDYYYFRHGRNSYDNRGGNMEAVVRVGSYANASWNPSLKLMFFGGDLLFAGSLDVVGHEMTHGVVNSIGTNGVLDYVRQSGALNEAFADIFGQMTEVRTFGINDWVLGSQLPSPYRRNMASPSNSDDPQPARMSEYRSLLRIQDQGGVHVNSGIINRCFYLLVQGLPQAIGVLDAERIFYRSLTQHMKPQSQFIDARLGCVAAAEILFGVGSIQALKTAEAFDAVEIFADPVTPTKPPSTRPAISAPDSTLYIQYDSFWGRYNLGRLETALDGSVGTTLVTNVKKSRMAVTGNGAGMAFVGADYSLCTLPTAGGTFVTDLAGSIHSLALSPDNRYLAFVLRFNGSPTNQIYLHDYQLNTTTAVNLVTPVADGPPIPNISYAGAMDFSSDGSVLIYDALSTIRQPDGNYRQAWSLFALDVQTLTQIAVVPPLPGLLVSNPAFSNTGDRLLTFEAYDLGSSRSYIFVSDLFAGTLGVVGITTGRYGYPCFNGGDSAVLYADFDPNVSLLTSIWWQALSFATDTPAANGGRTRWLSNAELGVIYRRGGFPAANVSPTVTLTSSGGTTFTSLANFTLTANASDSDGTISKVEFYVGSTLAKTDTSSPYTLTGTDVPAGAYQFTARAFDNLGAAATTPPLFIRVDPPGGAGRITPGQIKTFELKLGVLQTGVYRLEASTNLVNWTSLGTVRSLDGVLNFTDMAATNHLKRFYRAVKLP